MAVIVLGSLVGKNWLSWLGVSSFSCATMAMISLQMAPIMMGFVGNWWPWMGGKAVQLDCWLERDLDWG